MAIWAWNLIVFNIFIHFGRILLSARICFIHSLSFTYLHVYLPTSSKFSPYPVLCLQISRLLPFSLYGPKDQKFIPELTELKTDFFLLKRRLSAPGEWEPRLAALSQASYFVWITNMDEKSWTQGLFYVESAKKRKKKKTKNRQLDFYHTCDNLSE